MISCSSGLRVWSCVCPVVLWYLHSNHTWSHLGNGTLTWWDHREICCISLRLLLLIQFDFTVVMKIQYHWSIINWSCGRWTCVWRPMLRSSCVCMFWKTATYTLLHLRIILSSSPLLYQWFLSPGCILYYQVLCIFFSLRLQSLCLSVSAFLPQRCDYDCNTHAM